MRMQMSEKIYMMNNVENESWNKINFLRENQNKTNYL